MTEQTQNPFDLGAGASPSEPTSDDKLWSGLSYFSQCVIPVVLPLVLLFMEQTKSKAFVRHHAITSLGLLAVSVVYEILAAIVFTVLSLIPFVACIAWIVFLGPLVPFIMYGIKALKGETVEVPYLSEFMRKQGWL